MTCEDAGQSFAVVSSGYVPESLDTSLNRCLTLELITAGNRRPMDI
jgi:hypothetical protein